VGVALDLSEGAVTRRLPHGEVVVRQGDAVSSLFLVTAGAVRLSSVTAVGREVVVGLLCAGDLFGESALLGDPSPVRAQAVGSTIVLALPIPSLRVTLERHPETAEQLLRMVAGRLHRTSAALEDALAADVPTRIAGRLRELAGRHGVPGPAGVRIRVPLTQDELARMVGASRESVNRTIGALTSRGLLRTEGRTVVIRDPDELVRDVRLPLTPDRSPG
jgi:CRP/FNR family transcriptional regulator, cyclic AMP receptor protein